MAKGGKSHGKRRQVAALPYRRSPAGLEVLTLSTLAGPFGLVAGEGEATAKGEMRPLAHVLSRLGALAGQAVIAVETSRPDAVLGLATKERILLANITPETQAVTLGAMPRRVALIAADGEELPTGERITLPPYACVEVLL